MLKFMMSTVGIIFMIGLLVVHRRVVTDLLMKVRRDAST